MKNVKDTRPYANNRKATNGRNIQTIPIKDKFGNVVDTKQIIHRQVPKDNKK